MQNISTRKMLQVADKANFITKMYIMTTLVSSRSSYMYIHNVATMVTWPWAKLCTQTREIPAVYEQSNLSFMHDTHLKQTSPPSAICVTHSPPCHVAIRLLA